MTNKPIISEASRRIEVYSCPSCKFKTFDNIQKEEHKALLPPDQVFYKFPINLILKDTTLLRSDGSSDLLWLRELAEERTLTYNHDKSYWGFQYNVHLDQPRTQCDSAGVWAFPSLEIKDKLKNGELVTLTEQEFDCVRNHNGLKGQIEDRLFCDMGKLIRSTPELEELFA